MIDKTIEVVKKALDHSIAQAFLVFSGILVVVSITEERYIFVSFLTLFYALLNFKIEALRKHESLGEYAVGKDRLQIILFTLTLITLFIWWATGVWSLLYNLSWQKWYDLITPSWPMVSSYFLIVSIILMVVWLGCMFSKLPKELKPLKPEVELKESYELNVKIDDISLSLKKSKGTDTSASNLSQQ